jgi:hypothetical protein
MAQARRDPIGVVVAPRDRDVWLLHEQVDHLVDPRSAIAKIAGDHQLADREVANHARDHAHELEVATFAHERIDQAIDERIRAPELVREQQLVKARVERIRNDAVDVLHRVVARELANHHERARDQRAQRGAPGACREPGGRGLVALARVVDDRQQLARSVRR